MKLCVLAPEFLPAWGGVGTYVVELVRHLPKTYEIHVVAPSRQGLGASQAKTSDYDLKQYFGENVQVHFISSATDTFVYNAKFQYACFKFVPRLVRQTGIDLIHSHTAHMPDLLLQLRKMKVPVVTTVHTTIQGQRQGSKESTMSYMDLEFSEKATYFAYPMLRLAELVYFSGKRYCISVSNWMKTQLLQSFRNLKDSNIRVIHNSVDADFFSPERSASEKVVLFTGRLIALKGLAYLVDAIPKVLRDHPDALFAFVGPGNPYPYENRLRKLGVPSGNFRFEGYVGNRNDLLGYYRGCAVYVAPSLYENMPMGILEAMACAVPVVATNVGGIPEVITSEEQGTLVPRRSSEALAKAISALLQDSKRRLEIGTAARRRVAEEFNWTTGAKRIADLYDEILAL